MSENPARNLIENRLRPLNDFAFQKAMGEKGDEAQLLAFLGSVLQRTGKGGIQSVEILENKDLPAEIAGGKAAKLDVLAKLADGSKVNIEVQIKNEYNIEKRSLFYWSSKYIRDFKSGGDYAGLDPVIAVNILGFGCFPVDDFHTSFHLWEDARRDVMLTDVCEIHFLEMAKFRRLERKGAAGGFSLENPLHRWLAYFDEGSPTEIIMEVLKMDPAIQLFQSKMELIRRDPAMLRAYEQYEKAASDWTSGINGAKREGEQKGRLEGRLEGKLEIARNLLRKGYNEADIADITGLPTDTVAALGGQRINR
jgi:predicted transposase/invertase (TIGR01784 family)